MDVYIPRYTNQLYRLCIEPAAGNTPRRGGTSQYFSTFLRIFDDLLYMLVKTQKNTKIKGSGKVTN